MQMSDGKPYPINAGLSVMGRNYGPQTEVVRVHLQLSSCRLAARVLKVQADDFCTDLSV